jgi:hypothetical protein
MAALDLVRRDSDIARFGADSLGVLEAPRFRLLSEADVLALPDLDWLVESVLPAHGSALLYGPAGIGKSFLALDLALHLASTAETWHGRTLRPGAELAGWVLYLAAEGARGLKRRIRAWRTATQYTGLLGIRFLDVAVSLRTLDDPRELVEAIGASVPFLPDDAPDLIVLDTLSRCMAGADENSARDASAVIAGLDYLRATMGSATLAIHHTGIAETRERGSTVFRGAVDALLSLKEADGLLTLESDKVRDGPPLAPLHFRLMPVAESMVLAEADQSADSTRPLGKVSTRVWHSLRAIATAEGGTLTAWKESSGVPGTSFYRARKLLMERGLVVRKGRNYKPVEGAEVPGAK